MKRLAFLPLSFLLLACPQTGDDDASPQPTPTAPDTVAPGALLDLKAVFNEGTGAVDLYWVTPSDADLAGTLILRSVGVPVSDVPEAGTDYAVGDLLPNGATVVFVGEGTSTSDLQPFPGMDHYSAWPFDGVPNYGDSDSAQVLVPFPVQPGALEVGITDPQAMLVTVNQQPPHFEVGATARLRPASCVLSEDTEEEVRFEAQQDGALGNGISISYSDDGDGAPVTIAVVGTDISIGLDGDATTSGEVATALNSDASASLLVKATALIPGAIIDDGTRNCSLAGGSDSDIQVDVTLTNNGGRQVFNTKMLLTNSNDGTLAGKAVLGGDPLAHFGFAATLPGQSASSRFYIENFTGNADPIAVDFLLREDPVIFQEGSWDRGFYATDSAGSGMELLVSSEPLGFLGFDNDSRFRDGFVNQDSTMMYLGNFNMPTVVAVDLMTMLPTLGADLDDGSGVGHVSEVVGSPDGQFLFATVVYGMHAKASEPPGVDNSRVCDRGSCESFGENIDLVKLSLPNLTEVGRLNLITQSQVGARGRELSLSADGSIGAVPLYKEGKVALVDPLNMTLTQMVDLPSTDDAYVQHVAVSPDGLTTYVAIKEDSQTVPGLTSNDGTLLLIDNTNYAVTTLAPPDLSGGTLPGFLEFGPDGKLYFGRKNMSAATGAVSVYNPLADSWINPDLGVEGAYCIAFSGDGKWAVIGDGSSDVVYIHSLTGSANLSYSSNGNLRGHGCLVTGF